GPKTAGKLAALGCARLVDVRAVDPAALRRVVGSFADSLVRLAHGDDARPVVPDRPRKSCSTEDTFREDLSDADRMRTIVESMARHDAAYLAEKRLLARTVTLKVRYADFTTVTRSDSGPPTRDADALAARAAALLSRTEAGARPVRLLGVGVHGLVVPGAPEADGQLPLEID
ncbi:MAG TPA: DNA polymerase IV, partial [Thermoanaerobaculia bacterium]|nr:DNA polymerase IV [Thermoanaerobaculia bacterium]